ncbi:MAG: hypothetical protein FJY07_01515 [Bacteroidetes bacterium]|nr:hypothetical protein [Bacteroidota bacterium]
MDDETLRQELIERYLNGELKEAERSEFETRLENDPVLAHDLRFAQSLSELEEREEELLFRENLSAILHDIKKENESENMKYGHVNLIPEKKAILLLSKYRIAALLVILLSITALLFFLLKSSGKKEDQLFAQYFQPYSVDFISRSESDSLASLSRAFAAYNKADYPAAIQLFEKYTRDFPYNEIAGFFLGISLIAESEYPKAEAYLNKLTESPSGSLQEQAAWYLALIALKTDKERQSVINMFRKIAESGKYKVDEAAKIVAELQ